MALAYSQYTGDGSVTNFTVTFPYISTAYVGVYLDGTPTSAWSWLNATTIQFNTAPGNGVDVLIRRETTISSRLVNFTPSSLLNPQQQNTDSDQMFHILQELMEFPPTVNGQPFLRGNQGDTGGTGASGLTGADGVPGLPGSADVDLPYLLSTLNGQLTEDQLYTNLKHRIDFLDVNGYVYGAGQPDITQSVIQYILEFDTRLAGAELIVNEWEGSITALGWQLQSGEYGSITHGTITGTFTPGENLTFTGSGATAKYGAAGSTASKMNIYDVSATTPVNGDVITGVSSGATCTANANYVSSGHGNRLYLAEEHISASELQWTVKLQIDSQSDYVVGGVGLLLDPYASKSQFMILADQFKVVNPSLATDKKQVFTVGTIDGVTGQVGVHGNVLIDGSLIARHISAGEIQTKHLRVTGGGKNINQDGYFEDATEWTYESWPYEIVSDSTAPLGTNVVQSPSATGQAYPETATYYPIDTSRKYRVRFWAKSVGTPNGTFYFCLRQYKNNTGTTCDTNGGRSPYKPTGISPPATWTEYSYEWGGSDWQAEVKYVRPNFLLNYAGTVGTHRVAGVRFEEVIPGELIVDGAIQTSKIYSGSYTAPGDNNTTPGVGMKLDVDNGKIEAYGSGHSLGGNLVASDGNYLVAIGRKLTATGVQKRYPLHNATNFDLSGRINTYEWNGSTLQWVMTAGVGYESGAGANVAGYANQYTSAVYALYGEATSSGKGGIYGYSAYDDGITGESGSSATGKAGVVGTGMGNNYGMLATGTTRGPIRLYPSASASSPHGVVSADVGALWVTSDGVLYICTGTTNWTKVGAQ